MMKHFLLFLFLLLPAAAIAQVLEGRVADPAGEGLSYVNVYVEGTTKGTTTNQQGYYRLPLSVGSHSIAFQYLGYEKVVREVELEAGTETLNITLEPRGITLAPAIITDGEDPAYYIIRQAIAKRKDYLDVPPYSAEVYSKSLMQVLDLPDSFMGKPVFDSPEQKDSVFLERDDMYQGVVYLSETISEMHCRDKGQCQRTVTSSKTSGNDRGLSINFIFEDPIVFYENNVTLKELAPRGLISPIANNALFFYDYRLLGSYLENGELVYKIKVIPKRPNDPVFHGFIHIADSSWRIYSTDLTVNSRNGITMMDSVQVRQLYLPVNDSTWMLFNQHFAFYLDIFGMKLYGRHLGLFSDYELKQGLERMRPSAELLRVEDAAYERDSAFWLANRPVPLAPEEETDYEIQDSLTTVRTSSEYLDSVQRARNKVEVGEIISTGLTFSNHRRNETHYISPLLTTIGFNPVEGWYTNLQYRYVRDPEDRPETELSAFVRYGFSNTHLNGGTALERDPWNFAIGSDVVQFQPDAIVPFYNTYTAVFSGRNYMKLYEKRYAQAGWASEVFNGFTPGLEFGYEARRDLENTTDFTLFEKNEGQYLPNVPLYPYPALFGDHEVFYVAATAAIQFGQQYMTVAGRKVNLGSKWPLLRLRYERSMPGLLESDGHYDLLEAEVGDDISLKLLGQTRYSLGTGLFLNNEQVYFQDFRHFNGNEIAFATGSLQSFLLMDYYTHSTDEHFVEAHVEHNFRGFFFNKVPWVRKLNWQVVGGVNALYTPEAGTYTEFLVGIDNLLNYKGIPLLRMDVAFRFDERGRPLFGYALRLPIDGGIRADGNSVSIGVGM